MTIRVENHYNYNLTYSKKVTKFAPDNIKELIKFKKKNNFFFIKTGNCSYGDKSISNKSENLLSLENFNKILKIDKKKNIVEAEGGINLYTLSMYLYNKGYFIYNVPGGLSVTLGGAIAGNVHGRFSKKNFSNFGDNVKSLKFLNDKNKIVKINRESKNFNKLIGSFGLYGVILSAELYINKIQCYNFERIEKIVKNKYEFDYIFKKNENLYGFINHFNNEAIEGVVFLFKNKKNLAKKKFNQLKNYNWPKFLKVLSFFVNNLSLKILYKLIFFLKKNLKNQNKILSFEKILYHSSFINLLPFFFQKGMIEIQISINKKNFLYFNNNIKKYFLKKKIFPVFFIIKKMHISNKDYYSSFPKNNLSISLGFRKKDYLNENDIFKKFFFFLKKNKFDVYITKNEIFNNLIIRNKFLKTQKNIFLNSKVTNTFFEKLKFKK